MSLNIVAYSSVSSKGLFIDGELILKNKGAEFNIFSKEAYRFLNTTYPKFFKMDELSKLAFIATEALFRDQLSESFGEEDVAIVLGNKTSSIASDQRHAGSFEDRDNYFPSPAVFVYTLPNIMLGEICIRHQITGENTCFLLNHFDGEFLYNYAKDLFEQENYQYCITGWVDFCEGEYEAHLFLVSKSEPGKTNCLPFNKNFTDLINTRNG
jgi:hypothetical protein